MLAKEIFHSNPDTHSGLKIGKCSAELPIIQGGMGIGISINTLVGAVSREGGIGTLSSAGLCMLPTYKDVLQVEIAKAKIDGRSLNKVYQDANAQCIKLEVAKAKALAPGKPIFINIMHASNAYASDVQAACEAGVDGIVCGAGLPLDLPNLTKDFPNVALIPIVSNLQGARIFISRRQKYGRLPDAILLEDPSKAGGHLGARHIEDINNNDLLLENSVPAVKAYLKSLGYDIPVIAAGGMVNAEDIMNTLKLGASGVQLGSRFLASNESGANDRFKQAVVASRQEDIITYMSSAGLPARALAGSPVFESMKTIQAHARNCLINCLMFCGYKEGNPNFAQMCIYKELIKVTEAGKNGPGKGLRFVGKSAAEIHEVLSVKDIMDDFRQQLLKD